MILFPAVDIKGGQAVRLRRGRADDSTVFSDDPVAAALQWQEQGAKFLHLVDLDGAFEAAHTLKGVAGNLKVCRRIRIWSAGFVKPFPSPYSLAAVSVTRKPPIAGLMRVWPV